MTSQHQGRFLIITLLIFSSFLETLGQPFEPYSERYRRLVQSISFSPDDDTLYFTLPHKEYLEAIDSSVSEKTPVLAIYQATRDSDKWSEPVLLPFSGQHKDYEPSLAPGGHLMFFNSNRPYDGKSPEKNNIWYTRKVNGIWQEPEYLLEVNTLEFEESYPTITKSGDLYFIAERIISGKTEYAVYQTKFTNGSVGPIRKVSELDKPQGTGDPWVSPNGDYIIFTKFGSDWVKTCDLFISFRNDDTWSVPITLGDLNSDGPDFAVVVSPDEQWIYYRKSYQFIRAPFQAILNKLRTQD